MPRQNRRRIPEAIVNAIMAKSGHMCFRCRWGSRAHDIHHINFNHNDNDPDNLVPLCRNCHVDVGCVGNPVCSRAPANPHTSPPRRFTEGEIKCIRDTWYKIYNSPHKTNIAPEAQELPPRYSGYFRLKKMRGSK